MAFTFCDANNITECRTVDEWAAKLEECVCQDKLALTLYYGSWSAASKIMYDTLAQLSKAHPEVLFLGINIEVNKDVVDIMGVRFVPTIIILRKAKEVDRMKAVVTSDFVEEKILYHSRK